MNENLVLEGKMKKIILSSLVVSSTFVFLSCEQKQEAQTQVKEQIQQQVEKVEEKIKEEKANLQEKATEQIAKQEESIKEAKQQLEEKVSEQVEKVEQKVTQLKEATIGQKEEKQESTSVTGEDVFKAKGCAVCHHPEIDTTGPSLKKISQFYKGKREDLIKFLKGQGDPIVDPAKFTIMKPQINITKALSDEELNALVDYLLSF